MNERARMIVGSADYVVGFFFASALGEEMGQ